MNDQICNDLTEIFLTHIKSRSMTDVEILKDSTMVDASFSKYILDRVDFEKEQFYFTVNDWEEDRIVPAADIGTLRLFQRRELTKAINNGPLMEWVQYCRNSGIGQLGWVVEPDGEEATVKIHMSKKKTPKTRTTAPQYLAQEEFDSVNSFVVDAIKKESWVTFTQYSDADKHRNILTSISFSKNNPHGLITFNRPHPTRHGDVQESSYLIDPPTRNAFKSLIFSTGYICSFQDISGWVRDCAQQGVKLINKDGVHYDYEVDGEDDETEEKAQATESILDYDPKHPDIPTSYTPSAENKALLQKFDTVVRALTSERRILAKVVRKTGCSLSGNLNELNLESMTYTLNCEYPLAQVRAMDLVIEMGAKQDEGILFSGDDFKILQGLVSVRVREQLSMAVAAEFTQKKLHNRDYCWETLDNRLTDLEVELREKRKGAVGGTLSLLAGPVMGIALIDLYLKTNGGLKYQDANCVHNEYRVVSFDKIESLQTPALGEYPVLGTHLVKYAEDCTNMARMARNHRYLEEAYGSTYASEPGFTTDYSAGGLTNPCVEIPVTSVGYNESARGRTRPETQDACTCVCPCCGGQKTTATTHLNNINQNKGNNFMKSLTNMFGDIFGGPIGSAKSVGIDARTDMMTGNVIINQNGKYIQASVVKDRVSLTSVPKGMTFGGMPVFVFPVPVSTLKQNDIIVRDTNEILVVHSIDDDVIVALSLDKQEKIEVVPVGTVFLPGVKLVRKLTPLLGNLGNMFGGAPAAPAGQATNPMGGMNPMMMMAMAGGFGKDDGDKTSVKSAKGGSSEDDSENGDMMQMMLMSQMMGGQQAQGGMNPMMMAMMMNQGEGKGEGGMMQNMLMMQMMGGGNMFGGNPSAVPPQPQDGTTKGPNKTKA